MTCDVVVEFDWRDDRWCTQEAVIQATGRSGLTMYFCKEHMPADWNGWAQIRTLSPEGVVFGTQCPVAASGSVVAGGKPIDALRLRETARTLIQEHEWRKAVAEYDRKLLWSLGVKP